MRRQEQEQDLALFQRETWEGHSRRGRWEELDRSGHRIIQQQTILTKTWEI
jgi:hypothetical protein